MSQNKYKAKRIFLLIFLVPLLTGCWDSREIEQRATILAIGIDKAGPGAEEREAEVSHGRGEISIPEEDMIEITVQIAIPGRIPLGPQVGAGEKKPVLVVSVVGHTIEDAIYNLQQEIADEIFLGHLRLIVLSEGVAKEGVQRFNDYLRRNPEIRRTASIVVSKEKASKYMEVSPELERVPSLYLAEMVESLVDLGKFPESFIGKFWSVFSSKGQDGYLPYFHIKGNKTIQINGLAYFQGDKMVGKTRPQEIGSFMAGIGAEKGGYPIFTDIPGNKEIALVQAVKRKTRIKASLKNGNPHILVKVRYEGKVSEKESPNVKIKKEEDIRALERGFSNTAQKSLGNLIAKTQKAKSDIFGFGEYFRGQFPEYWKQNVETEEDWRNIYKNLSYDVEVDTYIRHSGMKDK
ncbi:Ger(x)C family spore germination protein [Peribacillus asahii]|uniref:Ger(x)C family spore germination protein n=1 Tax=Peribacillus asahii TaxID=228899 RepID=UPI00207A9924|nr:Ger(x)C family spore germination protein [Peribacillus asahii]USK60927.1 Ger(x)C family spore germination protein [Peribacillus asahii]